MPNYSLPILPVKTVLNLTDLTYVAKDDLSGWYTDSKMSVDTLKTFCNNTTTTVKTIDYLIPIAECDGRWFSNKGSSSIKFTLPASVEEVEVGFILEEAFVWTEIAPNGVDKIMPLSIIDGQSIYGSVFGNTIRLRGARDGWHVVSSYGAWSTEGSSSSSSASAPP